MTKGNRINHLKKYKDGRERWMEPRRKAYMKEYYQKNKSRIRIKVKKRAFRGFCELCKREIKKRLHWHHWDDEHPELGLWLCSRCHWFAGSVEYDPHQKLMGLYKKLKESASP